MSTDKASANGSRTGKVLRIGIIHGGKLIEERRLKKRENVSVGSSEKSAFSVVSPHLPKSMDVFQHSGGKYYVHFTDAMDGRVQSGKTTVRSFSKLRQQTDTVRKGEHYVVELTDDSRGKVMFGPEGNERVTILFQFVDPPLAPGRAQLPIEARGSALASIDIQFSSIFVVVAFTCVSVISYASKQPYVEPTSVEQISERYQRLIMPDRIPEPPRPAMQDEPEETGTEKTEKTKPAAKKKKPKAKPAGKKAPAKPVDPEAANRARKAAIAKEVAGKGLLGVIGVKGRSNKDGALADVFSEGSGVESDLGNAFSGIQGVDIAESAGQAATRGAGSGEKVGIGEIGTEGAGDVATGSKREASVEGHVDAETPEVDGAGLDPSTVKRAMRKYLSAVKDCYERALKRDPNLSGKIVVGFEISSDGKAAEFEFPTDTVGSASVRNCIKSRGRSWRFPRPTDGAVYVEFPMVFEASSR